jgi:hypothetical protein
MDSADRVDQQGSMQAPEKQHKKEAGNTVLPGGAVHGQELVVVDAPFGVLNLKTERAHITTSRQIPSKTKPKQEETWVAPVGKQGQELLTLAKR